MANERIMNLNMSTKDVLLALCGGNPGALRVCMDILTQGKEIDPMNALGGLGVLLSLDTRNVWEERIWMLYKDVCGEDLALMLAVLRCDQLGHITRSALSFAIDHRGQGLDIPAAVEFLKERLPSFAFDKITTPVATEISKPSV